MALIQMWGILGCFSSNMPLKNMVFWQCSADMQHSSRQTGLAGVTSGVTSLENVNHWTQAPHP